MKTKTFFTIAAIIFLLMATYFTIQMQGSGYRACYVDFEAACGNTAFGACIGFPWGYYMLVGICDYTTCYTIWNVYCESDYGFVSYYIECEGVSSQDCTQW